MLLGEGTLKMCNLRVTVSEVILSQILTQPYGKASTGAELK